MHYKYIFTYAHIGYNKALNDYAYICKNTYTRNQLAYTKLIGANYVSLKLSVKTFARRNSC